MTTRDELSQVGEEIDQMHDSVEHKVNRCLRRPDDTEAYLSTNEDVARYRELRARYARISQGTASI